MATPKSLRAAQPALMENYVVSIKNLNGKIPVSIPDDQFLESNFGGSSTTVGARLLSKPIGFSVNIDGIKYSEFYHYYHGWMFLKDPERDYSGSDSPWSDLTLSLTNNEFIKSTLDFNHLLVAPWYDNVTTFVKKTVDELALTVGYMLTTQQINDIKSGSDTRNWPYDAFDYGVRYTNSYDADKGKCLLVRWTNPQRGDYHKKFKFEVALFENGVMEFRYWPLSYYEKASLSAIDALATIGVFSGNSIGTNKFRDLSPLFDYRKNERIISQLGGSTYDVGFSDGGLNNPYASQVPSSNWPINGAIITLSPPTNYIKFFPKVVAKEKQNTRSLVSTPSLFDDRKTLNFTGSVTNIHMPSTLPSRLIGDTGDVNVSIRQTLIGPPDKGIVMPGWMKKNVIDNLLDQIDIYEKNDHSVYQSFNEGQLNYNANTGESEFYQTGSGINLFGPGFETPLKSKAQIRFSLPVNRPTTLSSLTSSFNYYDKGLNRWLLVDPSGYRPPEASVIFNGLISSYDVHDNLYFNRVLETSRGFDAVGRKIVSGSNSIDFRIVNSSTGVISYQTDNVVGLTYNQDSTKNKNIFSEALAKKYQNSITDNPRFFPENTQQIDVNIEEPFLVEKVVASIPMYASGDWFKDRTTCIRAFGDVGPARRIASGTMDFGGPALTFAIFCPRKAPGISYLDLIASGTITHEFDDKAEVFLGKEDGMVFHSLRPVGFRSFSNPSTVVSGTLQNGEYVFNGNVKLEVAASVAGGISYLRNDRSLVSGSSNYVDGNIEKATELLTSEFLTNKQKGYNNNDYDNGTYSNYEQRSPRVHIQNISPMSRGTSNFEFNGNSILGGTIAFSNNETVVKNPLFVGKELPSSYAAIMAADSNFNFDSVLQYSCVDSRPSPYLLMPGDKLTFAISKTRPVIHKMRYLGNAYRFEIPVTSGRYTNFYGHYHLTGSHNTVIMNSGSIEITLYGSYVREGKGYNP